MLHLQSTASPADIRTAYLQRVLQTHPDKGGSEHEFRAVVFAFEVLSDANARRAYDAELHGASSRLSSETTTHWSGHGTEWGSQGSPKRRKASSCEAKGWNSKEFLEEVCKTLRCLSPEARRSALAEEFSEAQRLRIEAHLKTQTSMACASSGLDSDLGESEETARMAGGAQRKPEMLDGSCAAYSEQQRRGIHRHVVRNTIYYRCSAYVNFGRGMIMFIKSRTRKDLLEAVQDHIIIAKIQLLMKAHAGRKVSIPECVRAVGAVLDEHGSTAGSGWRSHGASTDEHPECLFLRFELSARLFSSVTTYLFSVSLSDLRLALEAIQDLYNIRGGVKFQLLAFSELQNLLVEFKSRIALLTTDTRKTRQHPEQEQFKTFQLEEQRYLRAHAKQNLLRLKSLLQSAEKAKLHQESHAKRAAHAATLAAHREIQVGVRWDPRETLEQSNLRIAAALATARSVKAN